MKRIRFRGEDLREEYDDLDDLLNRAPYVGFEEEDGDRFMMARKMEAKGLAVSASSVWTTKEDQKRESADGYRIFGSAKELYLWLAEGED